MAYSDNTVACKILVHSSGPLHLRRSYGKQVEIWNPPEEIVFSSGDVIWVDEGAVLVSFPSGAIAKLKGGKAMSITTNFGEVNVTPFLQLVLGEIWYVLVGSPDDFQTPAASLGMEG